MGEIESMKLIKKGAEASLYLTEWHDRKVIMKVRLPKKYRPPELDERIRTYRTAHEPQLMHEAKIAGVPTPTIFLVDMNKASITMEYIEGQQVKKLMDTVSTEEGKKLCEKMGELIGNLHQHGVIHGDLTTSNMILTRNGKVFLVDFGLGEKNTELEAKGVDLHLMKRALQSTHYEIAEECFRSVMFGYSSVVGNEKTREVMEKIREIEQRGRYVAERQEEA
jgi:TP53 regulating kinase-like protein